MLLDAPSAVLWSGSYAANTACAWNIHAPGAITLTVDSVSLETTFDSVRVYSSASLSPFTLLETITGVRSPVSITAPSGHLYVVFTADSTDQGAGFRMAYTTMDVNQSPGGESTSLTGTASPDSIDWLTAVRNHPALSGGRRSDRKEAGKAEDATQPGHTAAQGWYGAATATAGVLVVVGFLVVGAVWKRSRERKMPGAQRPSDAQSVELQSTVDSDPAGANAAWV